MLEVYVEDRQVIVRFDDRGSFWGLTDGGQLVEQFRVPPGGPVWSDADPDEESEQWQAGYEEGFTDALDEVETEVRSMSNSRRRKAKQTTKKGAA